MKRIKIAIDQLKNVVNKVHSINNKSKFLIFCDLCLCMLLYGASPNNYYYFGFYKIKRKKRSTFVTNRLSEKIIKNFNANDSIYWFEDKKVFNNRFKDYIKRNFLDLSTANESDIINFYEQVKDSDKVIYKPCDSSRGRGIQVINFNSLEDLINKLKKVDKNAVVEQWIQQNDLLNTIYKDAVNCIRVITLVNNGKVNILASNITFGNEKQISNPCQNDLVCLVDIKSGEIVTNAVDENKKEYRSHPKTGAIFKGTKIPYFDQVLDMCKKAALEIEDVRYVGWDVAITNDGPVIIEGNTTPGYMYFQLEGLLHDYVGTRERYLKACNF